MIVTRFMNVIVSTYLQLWIISFQKSGVLTSKDESDITYRNLILGTQLISIICIPVFCKLSDKVDTRISIPLTFLAHSALAFSFKYISDPTSTSSYIICILLPTVTASQFAAQDALFYRNMRGEIRGTLQGLAFFFGAVGTMLFTLVGGIVFDQIAPWAPFMLISAADFICFIIAAIFIMCGLLKKED